MNRRACGFDGRVFAACLALLLGVTAQGGEAPEAESVWALLEARKQLQGNFEQRLFDEEGTLVERTEGRYAILRPGFFRWEIEAPDRQQITISRGTLWHYDLDLETVTVREVTADEQFTALDLLAHDRAKLAERFRVEALDAGTYRLLPLFPQAGFSAVELTWRGDDLVAMNIERRGGQTLSLNLSPLGDAAPLVPEDFDFEPPAGVEVQRAGGG